MKKLFIYFVFLTQFIYAQSVTCVYGTYVGTASSLTVTGIGFTPAAIFIKGGSHPLYIKTSSMSVTGSRAWFDNGALVTNAITGLTSNGFTIGTNSDVNTNGTVFYFLAISSSFTGMKVGSYTGNGSGGRRNIALSGGGLGEFAMVIPAASGPGGISCINGSGFAYGYNSGSVSGNLASSNGASASGIDVFPEINANLATYYYVAFLDVSGKAYGNSYTGNGSDNRNFTGVGFKPEAMFIYRRGEADVTFKTNKITTDNTMYFTSSSSAANLIQSFASNGFQLGNDALVNENSIIYYYMALGGNEVSTLPIELFHFDAHCLPDRQAVSVNWITTSEVNNDYFTVEKSIDGTYFEPVATAKGAGNSNETREYTITDESPLPGVVNYYRLRQTDFDGKTKVFNSMASNCEEQEALFELTILTNPISEEGINYNFNSSKSCLINMKLYNETGQLMDEQNYYHRQGIATYSYNSGKLLPGIYSLVIHNDSMQKTVKIVKQK